MLIWLVHQWSEDVIGTSSFGISSFGYCIDARTRLSVSSDIWRYDAM